MFGLKKFIEQCKRVLKTTKKPSRKEFITVSKVAGIGLLLIGLIGFVLFILKQLLFA